MYTYLIELVDRKTVRSQERYIMASSILTGVEAAVYAAHEKADQYALVYM